MTVSADPTKDAQGAIAADEVTPLLGASAAGATRVYDNGTTANDGHINGDVNHITSESTAPAESDPKPFPYTQILTLCFVSLGEPLAYFSIFPYVNEMIYHTGSIPETEVGYWSGLIESCFSLVQMVLMIFYGRAADRLGRKPVLVFSMAGVSCAVALFGFSRTLWQMILFRCVAGLFAGSVVTIRCMLSENCDRHGQARSFSWFMFTRQLGILFGPLIGGAFARPAHQYPSVFGKVQFFLDYPYALPSLVTSSFCAIGTILSIFVLRETLSRDAIVDQTKQKPMSTWDVLKAPGVPIALFVFAHAMFLGLAYTALSPVTLFTSISKGGFSFTDQQIAGFMALAGLSQSTWMLFGFPYLQKRLGTVPLLKICGLAWPFFMLQAPFFNFFRRQEWDTAFWILGPISSAVGSGVSMAFACVQLCINDVSPSPHVLATINALALTVNSGVRAVAPIIVASMYAAGVKAGWLNGQLGWLVMSVIAAGIYVACTYLPASEEQQKDVEQQVEEEDIIR